MNPKTVVLFLLSLLAGCSTGPVKTDPLKPKVVAEDTAFAIVIVSCYAPPTVIIASDYGHHKVYTGKSVTKDVQDNVLALPKEDVEYFSEAEACPKVPPEKGTKTQYDPDHKHCYEDGTCVGLGRDSQSDGSWREKQEPKEHQWCEGHVKQRIDYPDGSFWITCDLSVTLEPGQK